MNATHTILLAEEDKTVRTFLADNLAADGYKVIVARDVNDALHKLEREHPAAVIADLNGASLTLVDKVRAADELSDRLDPETPLMILSRKAHEIDRLRGYQRGCDDYLGKPFSYPELLARLRRRLARAVEATRARCACSCARLRVVVTARTRSFAVGQTE